MKLRLCLNIAVFAQITLLVGTALADNILTNGGFETGDFTGWTTFGNYLPNVSVESSPAVALSGEYYLKVFGQFNGATNDSGVYQENPSKPGAVYSADGWAYTLGSDGGGIHGEDTIWLEVTFRDINDNPLALYRSEEVTSNNLPDFGGTNTWFDLPITNQCAFSGNTGIILYPGTVTNSVSSLVAPAGTAHVRYQVVFQQGPDNANASMYFDDLNLNQTGGTTVPPPAPQQWNIVWDDEFNGTTINTNIWTFETGNGAPNNPGWGNNELEYYTSRTNNAYVSGGLLHIVVRQENTNGFSFTSARMKTQGLYATPTYGRFEWRARLPYGTGMWPALWMMGTNITEAGWPACGEIDVVENNGGAPFVQGSLHSNAGGPTAIYDFSDGESVTNFHTYLLDWEANSISWYVDGQLYETQSGGAPFNAPFFLLMNVAVGGNYVSNPSVDQIEAGTVFPQEMQVDYVRIYELTAPLQLSTSRSNGQMVLSWPTNIVCHLQAQTNSLPGDGWFDLTNTPDPYTVPVNSNNAGVYYRLQSP